MDFSELTQYLQQSFLTLGHLQQSITDIEGRIIDASPHKSPSTQDKSKTKSLKLISQVKQGLVSTKKKSTI